MWFLKSIFWVEEEKIFDKKDSYRIFVFDTETTWTDVRKDRIVQFSWILWTFTPKDNHFREERAINELVNFDWDIPEEASKIHWIYKKDIEGCKDMSYFIEDLIQIIDNVDYVVWHNVEFDLKILSEEEFRIRNNQYHDRRIDRVKIQEYNIPQLDTMKSSSEIVNGRWGKWPKLIELYRFLFHKDFDWAHDSMADVRACLDCFIELSWRYWVFDVIFNPELAYKYNRDKFRYVINWWFIDDLQYVTDEQMEEVLNYFWEKSVSLKKLKRLTNIQAELICNNYQWCSLDLSWLEWINRKQAECFYRLMSSHKYWHLRGEKIRIHMDWIKKLSGDESFYLLLCYSYNSEISLKWLTEITDKFAEQISEPDNHKRMYFPNLKTITEKQAKIFIKNRYFIHVSEKFIPPIDQDRIQDHYYFVDKDEREFNRMPMPDPEYFYNSW